MLAAVTTSSACVSHIHAMYSTRFTPFQCKSAAANPPPLSLLPRPIPQVRARHLATYGLDTYHVMCEEACDDPRIRVSVVLVALPYRASVPAVLLQCQPAAATGQQPRQIPVVRPPTPAVWLWDSRAPAYEGGPHTFLMSYKKGLSVTDYLVSLLPVRAGACQCVPVCANARLVAGVCFIVDLAAMRGERWSGGNFSGIVNVSIPPNLASEIHTVQMAWKDRNARRAHHLVTTHNTTNGVHLPLPCSLLRAPSCPTGLHHHERELSETLFKLKLQVYSRDRAPPGKNPHAHAHA